MTASKKRAQRGAGALVALFALLAALASGEMWREHADAFEQLETQREGQSRAAVENAKFALMNYMLLRAERDIKIRQGDSTTTPRLLMLPCPDNVGGDDDLDGGQEGSCRALPPSTNNLVKHVLDEGSRFGRLPWRTGATLVVFDNDVAVDDGVDIDVRDAAGNRLWYAVSRNMAPAQDNKNVPLNLHRLATHYSDEKRNEWLWVVDGNGNVGNEKVAAVILAPEQSHKERASEKEMWENDNWNYNSDVQSANGMLNPERFFESIDADADGDGNMEANYSYDGIFIDTHAHNGFNDVVSYVSLDDMMRPPFLPAYEKIVGIGDVHNAPLPDRPLAHIQEALAAYYDLLGFYPTPAAQTITDHVTERGRQCQRFPMNISTVALFAGAALAPAAHVTVNTANVVLATLTADAPFLLQTPIAITGTTLTMAMYSRVTLEAGAKLLLTGGATGLENLSGFSHRLSAAVAVELNTSATVRFSSSMPNRPAGMLTGWLPHYGTGDADNITDNRLLHLQADTRAMFYSTAKLINGTTVTLTRGDILTLAASAQVKVADDYAQVKEFDAEVFWRHSGSTLLADAEPDEATYEARHLALWLLTDTSLTQAPALVLPWKKKYSQEKDNLHAHPPCFDARDFWGKERLPTFMEDQTMPYMVAANCHTDDFNCRGGLQVSLAVDAAVASPQAYTLSLPSSYVFMATVGGVVITLDNGRARGDFSLAVADELIVPDASGADTLARLHLPAGYALANGAPVTLAAGMTVSGGTGVKLNNVQALIIYSPAPLTRAACTVNMATTYFSGTINANMPDEIKVVDQTTTVPLNDANNITPLCFWVDDNKNADGDEEFIIFPRQIDAQPPSNDYFMIFGGQLEIG